MGSQDQPGAIFTVTKIKGVMLLAGGMLGRNVELGEIIVVGFDVGAFGNGKEVVLSTQGSGEYFGDLIHDLGDRMDAPLVEGARPHRQGDVGALRGQAF